MTTEINYSYSGNELTIKNTEAKVSFPYEIGKVLAYQNMFIVLLNTLAKAEYNRNIFGVHINGDIIWHIKDFDDPFTNIALENEELLAYNWDGLMYYIKPATGKIIYKKFVK